MQRIIEGTIHELHVSAEWGYELSSATRAAEGHSAGQIIEASSQSSSTLVALPAYPTSSRMWTVYLITCYDHCAWPLTGSEASSQRRRQAGNQENGAAFVRINEA